MTVTTAQLDAALATLADVVNPTDVSLQAFVIANAGSQALLAAVPLDTALRSEFAQAAADKAQALCNLTPLGYSPSIARSDGHYLYVNASAGALANYEGKLSDADAQLFDPRSEYAKQLRLFVVRVSSASGSVVSFYRVLKPTAWLSKSRGIAALWSDGRFKKMTDEGIIVFDTNFDTVVAGDVAFFTSKQIFERTFDYMEEMKKGAKKTFTKITSKLRIADIEKMEHSCTNDPNMMAKMASVQRRMDADDAYANSMTMKRLVAFVNEHPHYDVEVRGSGDEAQLVYHNDPKRRYKILHLLDDDYLRSALTDKEYEANSKSDALK